MCTRILTPLLGCLVLTLATTGAARAGTVVGGTVEGTWGPAGSPYWVEADLAVASGTTLTIEPGVDVRFRGPYRFLVQGVLVASGAETDSIVFTRDAPGMEWRGIRLINAGTGTEIAYCRIEHVRSADNYPDVRGGAIYCETCSPLISHCLLQNNVSHNANQNGMGGGVACVSASPTIEFCHIRNNQADSGGGICTLETGAAALIRNNLIEGNTAPYCGGGIYAGVRSSPVIENNRVTGNTAYGWGGGGITLWNWYAAFPVGKTVRNNLVTGNHTTTSGGGFYIRYDFSVLENNTVADNTAASRGGGVYVLNQGAGDFPPHLQNWIVWGNVAPTDPGIHTDPSTGSVAYATYSDIQGGWGGTGNVDLPPEFVDADYHLDEETSPCVDAGNPGEVFNDLCFPPSLGTGRNDMGAYGGPGACGWPTVPSEVAEGGTGTASAPPIRLVAAPNPFCAAVEIRLENEMISTYSTIIYDIHGRRVRRLDPSLCRGTPTRLVWDGRDELGRPVPAGVYAVQVESGGLRAVVRVVRLR